MDLKDKKLKLTGGGYQLNSFFLTTKYIQYNENNNSNSNVNNLFIHIEYE